jgi:hypothetical protein
MTVMSWLVLTIAAVLFHQEVGSFTLKHSQRSAVQIRMSASEPPARAGTTNANLNPGDPPIRSAEWARRRGLEPGYGGYWPGNPDAKKYKVTIKSKKTGEEFTAMVRVRVKVRVGLGLGLVLRILCYSYDNLTLISVLRVTLTLTLTIGA